MTLIDTNPDGLHALPGVVTQVVTVPDLRLVYTSGQVAWDKDGNLVGEGDYAKQAEQVVHNLDIALAAAGTTRDHLIKQTIYVVDYRPDVVPLIMGPLHAETRRCAASALVGVQTPFRSWLSHRDRSRGPYPRDLIRRRWAAAFGASR